MLRRLLVFFPPKKSRIFSLFFSLTIALTFIFANVLNTYAIPWQDIFNTGVQVFQISTLSDSQEVQLGKQIRQELINSGEIKLYQNPNLKSYLNGIGQKLVKVSDRSNIPYNFEIVNSDEVNAFATMGGFIYIHTGLMKTASNEAELASVVGHEIGHVVAKHSVKQMRQEAIAQGVLTASGLDQRQAVQIGVQLLSLRYSRQDEKEADQLGLQMLTKASYAPGPMIDFMRKLEQLSAKVPTILSSHPDPGFRANLLSQQIPSNKAYVGNGLNSKQYQQQIRVLYR
jgi:predicted Zn-dependent protease